MKKPALISLCFTGCPCRHHARPVASPRKIEKLSKEYYLIPVCPEQMGGLPTPRPAAPLCNKIDGRIFNVCGEEVTNAFRDGAQRTLEIAQLFNCQDAFLCKNSPSCDKMGFTGELLEENGVRVTNL